MKLSGRTIKQRLYGLRQLPGMVVRARYFRGHGVHSPYVYSIVRQVFMKSKLINDKQSELFNELIKIDVPKRRAVELQNLMLHCGYESYAIDSESNCNLLILTESTSDNKTKELVNKAAQNSTTVVIMRPYSVRERTELCNLIIEAHTSTTVDNHGYLLIFNNHLPKQHFVL